MPDTNSLNLRPYTSADLAAVLAFVGECYARMQGCGCLHPGDVAHAMSNSWRGHDLDQHIFLAEGEGNVSGRIRALLLVYSAHDGAFDIIVAPEERGGSFERALLQEGLRRTRALLARERPDGQEQPISIDAMDCDEQRRALLSELGFTPDPAPSTVVTTRPLAGDLPTPPLPEGYTLRAAAGEHDAAALAAVHNASFTPKWTPEAYLAVMRTPGFTVERELVAVAPDGSFAAFLIYWLDPISRTGEFEPVGTAHDHQRRGLASALLAEGMRRMRAAGMDEAMVVHLTTNPPAEALYHSVGFRPCYTVTTYHHSSAE